MAYVQECFLCMEQKLGVAASKQENEELTSGHQPPGGAPQQADYKDNKTTRQQGTLLLLRDHETALNMFFS